MKTIRYFPEMTRVIRTEDKRSSMWSPKTAWTRER
jgi:hypothetical protein